jgi:hypothetical protein
MTFRNPFFSFFFDELVFFGSAGGVEVLPSAAVVAVLPAASFT